MLSKRIVALAFGALFLFMLAAVWIRGGDDFSDGDQAISRLSSLHKGMSTYQAIQALHPERMAKQSGLSYSARPNTSGGYETIHALTPDRYVVLTVTEMKPASRRPSEPVLKRWELRDGPTPREDVTIGRVLRIGPFRFRY